ncbi:MAG: tRNA 4-thiouridine(8) synthase ThiI [Treponema sp.]|jgi:thiamine biosynthesis protein ThiI|nr:tRNA 4-thiouridine(8) synthase ThiI [Treponema sp.]
MSTYLLKLGELTLKGENRKGFEQILKRNLLSMLQGTGAKLELITGRFLVRCPEAAQEQVEAALAHLFGIAGWAKTRTAEKTVEGVLRACVSEAQELFDQGVRRFKIEARRTDKSFPLDSYGLRCEGGAAVLQGVPGLQVDVHAPDAVIAIEIREKAYIYGTARKGLRGLPVGTAGRGLLLLSGGIDSPVAGYMMASRGMHLDAVYFHAYPYTSEGARQKVRDLAALVGRYARGIRLYTVSFTPVQLRIQAQAPEPWRTVLLRMAMMEGADKLAQYRGDRCLITGESLSQVASQTIENISCTESLVSLPVLRPLIGMDKEQIIRLAERIGTYATSILPYQDCCVLFSPPHPVLRGDPTEARQRYEQLELSTWIDAALRERDMEKCGFPVQPRI